MKSNLITVGQIIDQAWDHYRKHFVEIISVAAWLLILGALYTIAFAFYPSTTDILTSQSFTGLQTFGIVLASLTSFILAPIMGIWLFSAIVKMIDKQAKAEKIDLKKHAKGSFKIFWPLVLINILFTLLIASPILLFLPGVILGIVGGMMTNGILTFIGVLLFVIGLIAAVIIMTLWSIRYFFVGYALVIDNQRGKSAFKESHSITKGRFWAILWRLLVPKILYFLILALAQYLIVTIVFVVISALMGNNIDLAERIYSILQTLVGVSLAILINPMVLIADYLIYQSVKTNKA